MTKKEWVTISAAATTDQKEQLDQKAADCGMTPSEYIKARLFVDQDNISELNSKNLSKFDKDLISAVAKSYTLIQLIAEKLLTKEDIEDSFKEAENMLIEKGYKDSNN